MFNKYRKPTIGLVLNGGGARGPFQFGVYLGLIKYGLHKQIKATSGASIGAFSSVFFLTKDPYLIYQTWLKIDNQLIKSNKTSNNIFSILTNTIIKQNKGYYSRENLADFINNMINLETLLKDNIPTYVSLAECVKENDRVINYKPKYVKLNNLTQNEIVQYLLATSAIPMVFDPVTINGVTYVDPMKADNEPYKPIIDNDFDFLFIVPLNNSHLDKFYPKDFCKPIVDFSCPQLFKMKTLNMLDFDVEKIDEYISLGYQTADLLLKCIKDKKELHMLTSKQKKNCKQYYSLKTFNIQDINFDIIPLKDIIKDVNKHLSSKEQIDLWNKKTL